MDPNSLSFIRFQYILHDSGGIFSKSWNFCKLRRRDLISQVTQFCKNSQLFRLPLLHLNFKSFVDPNSSSFIRFQCIFHDSGLFFWQAWHFYKLKKGDLISGLNQFYRKFELFSPSFCISVLKVLWTQIRRHSLHLNAFYMIEEYFSQSLEISTI